MGYRKIPNLQINHPLFLFKEVYAMEKIHGTSSHIILTWTGEKWEWKAFAGGIKYNDFVFMLNTRYQMSTEVIAKLTALTTGKDLKKIILYGEGYGGRCQGMGDVYGPLNFVVFEVVKDDRWCGVEESAYFVNQIGLPFVYYERGPATVEWLDSQRNRPSEQAKRNGMGDTLMGEGIVVRAPMELYDDNDGRLLAKYKRENFKETRTARSLTEEDVEALNDAKEIAEEWVVEERLNHVLSALVTRMSPVGETRPLTIKDTGLVIQEMIQDVSVEAAGQIEWSDAAAKAISKKTAELFHRRLKGGITNPIEGC